MHSKIETNRSMSSSTTTSLKVSLSTKGFQNLPPNLYENDFTFIVGENRYHCPTFLASFLSPRICQLQMNDPTLQEFSIETKDPTSIFDRILQLCYGSTFEVGENISIFRSIICELNNRELYEELFESFESTLTILNVVDRLKFLFSNGDFCDCEFDFCLTHFSELDLKSIFSLPFELILSLISNESIQLKDEDSLYEMILIHQKEDSRFFSLFEYVRFEYLSTNSMESFIEIMNKSFNFLTFPIWQSLCHRLSLSVSKDLLNDRFPDKYSTVICPFENDFKLKGILSYLTEKYGNDIIDRNIISITVSSIGDPQFAPLHEIVNFKSENMFRTKDLPNSWICYDFKNMRIEITKYSIRSRYDSNTHHLRSWILEGSNDGLKWLTIDDRKEDESLIGIGGISTFSISKEIEEEFRMIRLRQTGKNSWNSDSLIVSAIEFFGSLKELK
jgi:hypothetical protein